jgi:aryl-alcohol dehydrogenase-like predicted oxidoreductase
MQPQIEAIIVRYRLLGNTGLYVSELCLGTMTYGGRGSWEVMGKNGRGHSRFHLFNEVHASLKRLQLDHIDLYQLHSVDPMTPLDEALSALNDLVRAGKVRYIGLCNMAAWQIMKALSISERHDWSRAQSVQAHYTIAGRDVERELAPLILDQHLGLMVWSPLAGGLLTGKYTSDGKGPEGARRLNYDFPLVDKARAQRCINVMRPIAERRQISVAQVAIAWLLSKPIVSSVIVGAKTTAQLRDNLAAGRVQLSTEDLRALDEISQLPQEYPEWMMSRQARARPRHGEDS